MRSAFSLFAEDAADEGWVSATTWNAMADELVIQNNQMSWKAPNGSPMTAGENEILTISFAVEDRSLAEQKADDSPSGGSRRKRTRKKSGGVKTKPPPSPNQAPFGSGYHGAPGDRLYDWLGELAVKVNECCDDLPVAKPVPLPAPHRGRPQRDAWGELLGGCPTQKNAEKKRKTQKNTTRRTSSL